MTARRKSGMAVALALTALAVPALLIAPYLGTVGFLLDLTGARPDIRAWLPGRPHIVTWHDERAPTRYGEIPTRIYTPDVPTGPTLVVFPGIHGGGVDEPRFAAFCTRLASTGLRVVCTPLPGLRAFRVTGESTDIIEDVTNWVAGSTLLSPNGRVVLAGVSFAGGLALVAAGRTMLDGKLDAVISLGGHGSLARTLRYLCTGDLPDGTHRPPHDYGLAVVALAAVPLLVPPAQVAPLTHAIETYLEASLDATPTRERGTALLAQARREGEKLEGPARSIAHAVTERDVRTLGRLLADHVPALTRDAALSAEGSRATMAPVFLLHGRDDNVIPSTETPLVATYLEAHGNTQVRWLLTPIVSHADIDADVPWADLWALVRFWHEARQAMR